MENVENSISREFHFFSLIKFATPTVIMMIITALYTIIDSIFVSRYVGTNGLSAINIIYPVLNVLMAIAIMFSTGGSAVIARKLGSGYEKEARSNLSLIYVTGFLLSVILVIACMFFIKPLIYGLGATEVLFDLSKQYLVIMLFFAPALVIQIFGQSFIVVAGNPNFGLTLSIISGVVNIILDYIFIVPLNMGIAGAAIATGIGYSIGAIGGVIYLLKNKGNFYFEKPVVDFKMLGESCFNGSSEMVTNIAVAIVTFLYNLILMEYLGEDGVAAITIMLYAQFLLNALFMGFSMGVAPVISFNHGAENHVQLKRIFRICIGFISVSSILVFITALWISPYMMEIFTPVGSNVYDIAISGFPLFSLSFLFVGINIFASSLFTALSNGKISAIISFLRTFVFIIAGLTILPPLFHIPGIWLSVPVAELLAMVMSIGFILAYGKKYRYI
ncbi:MAG: MATE family efflux transporter [Clostridium sp.]